MPDPSPELLREMLGMPEPVPGRIASVISGSERAEGLRIIHLRLGAEEIPALCLRPERPTGLGILYCHAHGNRPEIGKAELTEGRPALCNPPLGLALARAGATVLCPDMPGFGARQTEGPESALAKSALWQGRTLLGEMLTDLAAAHHALSAMPRVDSRRVAALGISMGGTLAYMHAALNRDVAACAQLCVMADIAPLLSTGAHDLHGPYMTIPGLLPAVDMGDIAGLVAPRKQFIATGGRDPLTPEPAYRAAISRVRRAYADAPECLTLLREPETGHAETPEMRQALFGFLGLPTSGR